MAHPAATNARRSGKTTSSAEKVTQVAGSASKAAKLQATNLPVSCFCCSCSGCCTCPPQSNPKTTTGAPAATGVGRCAPLKQNSGKQTHRANSAMQQISSTNGRVWAPLKSGQRRRPAASAPVSTSSASSREAAASQPDGNKKSRGAQDGSPTTSFSAAVEPAPPSWSKRKEKVRLLREPAAAQQEPKSHRSSKNCTKCMLIARFTTTQARLATQRQQAAAATNLVIADTKVDDSTRCNSTGFEDERANSDDVSSLTASSLAYLDNDTPNQRADSPTSSIWSLSSCYDDVDADADAKKPTKLPAQFNPKRLQLEIGRPEGHVVKNHRRRQAPLPPPLSGCDSNNNEYRKLLSCDGGSAEPEAAEVRAAKSARGGSVDSGNTSGTSRIYCDDESPTAAAAANEELRGTGSENQPAAAGGVNLLSETEIYSIEHSLRSLKSSTYVCGCLANLYLTTTCLANNGRHSRPTSWQLSRTGVPVLTFDSGLARNRDKRRLCINLAERGSGFILWSDVIDHLSNYRAYSTEVDDADAGAGAKPSGRCRTEAPPTCDTFHVMYLSSNHRLMVGLSFDDAHCARLFLGQVELITSDPANISLTGPKRPLAKRTLSSMNRLGRLIVAPTREQANRKRPKQRKLSPSAVEIDQSPPPVASSMGCLNSAATNQHLTELANRMSRSAVKLAVTDGTKPGWSTLRRVMRLGKRVGLLNQSALSSTPTEANKLGLMAAAAATPWLRPRPLVSLATAGRNFRRLPRKCDISAPCLFEHVTRVDPLNLERLYSRSLVTEEPPAAVTETREALNVTELGPSRVAAEAHEMSAQPKSHQAMLDEPRSQEATQKFTISSSSTENHHHHHRDNSGENHQQFRPTAGLRESNDRSASSSCYSSASISPASSDNSSDHGNGTPVARCGPPIPPLRRTAATGSSSSSPPPPLDRKSAGTRQSAAARNQQAEAQQQQPGAKVKAIIRELQSQASADMVDAKRLLMADIAATAAARLIDQTRSVSRL